MHTVGVRQGPGGSNGTRGIGIRAIRKLVPVLCISVEVLRLYFHRVVDVDSRESFTRVDGSSIEFGIVEYLEADAEWNALLVRDGSDWNSTRPQQDGVVERIPLNIIIIGSEVLKVWESCTYTGNYNVRTP